MSGTNIECVRVKASFRVLNRVAEAGDSASGAYKVDLWFAVRKIFSPSSLLIGIGVVQKLLDVRITITISV